MKKLCIYILTIFFVCDISFSQTYSEIVDDEIIHELIIFEINNSPKNRSDRVIGKKRVNSKRILWSNAMISIIDYKPPVAFENQIEKLFKRDNRYNPELTKLMDLLSNADINYMKEQFENETEEQWNFKAKKGRISDNPRNKFYTYSVPLFNKEHTIAIIYKEFYCGNLCAAGTVEVYIKKNDKWEHYKSIGLWVS